ncbi:peptidoglycan-binding protein [Actinophytocola sp.]|uniref:peptidoglycan-binding domain-containing protein n=1 Tax=Actinophytocola sp. TaxID=1872138 RepID=UPI002ED501ED
MGQAAAEDLVAGRQGCAGVRLSYSTYPRLDAGAPTPVVKAAQCLLRAAGLDTGPGDPTGILDAATAAALRQFQSSVALPVTGAVDSRTWTALLARGTTPVLRDGATGEAVFRLQRALNAATTAALTIDEQFGPRTVAAVRTYQSSRGLTVDGVVGPNTWAALQAGR